MDETDLSPAAPDELNDVVLLGARFQSRLAPIYSCTVGTVLTVSLKIVPAVDCCARLCTKSNLLLISCSQGPHPSITLRF